jgi:hypothetical protein
MKINADILRAMNRVKMEPCNEHFWYELAKRAEPKSETEFALLVAELGASSLVGLEAFKQGYREYCLSTGGNL